MGVGKQSFLNGALAGLMREIGSDLSNKTEIGEFVKSLRGGDSKEDSDPETYDDTDYDGGYYDAKDDRFPVREEGVVLINGKPYKPPKNKFGW